MKRIYYLLLAVLTAFMLTGCSSDNRIAEGLGDVTERIGEMFAQFFEEISNGEMSARLAEIIDGGRVWIEDLPHGIPGNARSVDEMIEKGEMLSPWEEEGEEEPGYGQELTDEEIMLNTTGMLRFSYARLSEDSRKIYKDIYTILLNQADKVSLETTDTEEVDRVFTLVMNDHPELFYVTGYSVGKLMLKDIVLSLEFSGTYDKDKDEVSAAKEIIDDYTRECLGQMPSGSDYEKAKYVYEYIINNTDYELGAEDNQNILSVFKNGKSVCNGYAKATQYLLNKAGIPCLLVSGTANPWAAKDEGEGKSEGHAWNEAYIDGDWTYLDTTWGDASYRNIMTGYTWNKLSYEYFCVGDAEFLKTHFADSTITIPHARKIRTKSNGGKEGA